jgi:molybdopterin synthase catalytic subunit
MKTHIEFTRSPIVPPAPTPGAKEVGAQVEFLGIVRELENDQVIAGLFYEAYEPMARATLTDILCELSATNLCGEVWFIHRLNFVPAGEASLFIRVQSQHRQAALHLTALLIDRLKKDVPIWKSTSKQLEESDAINEPLQKPRA